MIRHWQRFLRRLIGTTRVMCFIQGSVHPADFVEWDYLFDQTFILTLIPGKTIYIYTHLQLYIFNLEPRVRSNVYIFHRTLSCFLSLIPSPRPPAQSRIKRAVYYFAFARIANIHTPFQRVSRKEFCKTRQISMIARRPRAGLRIIIYGRRSYSRF